MLFAVPAHGTPAEPFMRGMTISSQSWGWEWGTPAMDEALAELGELGVSWIALHPYAWIRETGELEFESADRLDYLRRAMGFARDRGLRVMLIPHIGYWGTRFLWRGEIRFEEAGEWDRFFADYERWIVGLARLAEEEGVGVFCVGLEYDHAQRFEARWRRIIAAVRATYSGRCTYGAHHATYAEVGFWDALDYIGILSYEPLSKKRNPSLRDLRSGWEAWMTRLEPFARERGRRVLFVEVGFNESSKAASAPWDFALGGTGARAIRARCVESALELERRHPFLAGMFFWKWFPQMASERDRQNFDMRDPEMRRILKERWGAGG